MVGDIRWNPPQFSTETRQCVPAPQPLFSAVPPALLNSCFLASAPAVVPWGLQLPGLCTEGLMQGYTCAFTVRPVYHGIDRRCFRPMLRWNAGRKNVFAMLHLRHESASVAKPDPPRTAPKGRNIGSRQAASVDDVTGSCQQQPSPRGVRSAPAPMQAGVPRNVARATP